MRVIVKTAKFIHVFDEAVSVTVEDEPKPIDTLKRGRPRIYATAAERQRAYRARKKEKP